MDYYTQLKPGAEKAVGVLAGQFGDSQKQISLIKKRLADEQASAERVQTQIDKLKELSGASLIEGQNSYEKFKTCLRTRNTERDTALEIVQTLRDEILPKKEAELSRAGQGLRQTLLTFFASKREVCEGKMSELLGVVVGERDAFMDACEQIFRDYGLTLLPGHCRDVTPRALHPRIDLQRPGCVILWRPPAEKLQEKPEK